MGTRHPGHDIHQPVLRVWAKAAIRKRFCYEGYKANLPRKYTAYPASLVYLHKNSPPKTSVCGSLETVAKTQLKVNQHIKPNCAGHWLGLVKR